MANHYKRYSGIVVRSTGYFNCLEKSERFKTLWVSSRWFFNLTTEERLCIMLSFKREDNRLWEEGRIGVFDYIWTCNDRDDPL